MNKFAWIFLTLFLVLMAVPILTAQLVYHQPTSTGDTSPHVGRDSFDASGVIWYEPDQKWFNLLQTEIEVYESNGTYNGSTSVFSCSGSASDHEGITTINETSDIIIVQTENGDGICILNATRIIANATVGGEDVTPVENFNWPAGDADCGSGMPSAGGAEGVTFIPDSTLVGTCRYDGFLLAEDQNGGSGGFIYKYCINVSSSNLDCLERWSKNSCSGSYETAALMYDHDEGLLYVDSDNGNAVCVADPFDYYAGYIYTISDPNTGGRTDTFEGISFGNGSFAYADDGTSGTDDDFNGLWLFIDNPLNIIFPQFSNHNDNNGTSAGSIALFNSTVVVTNGTVFLEINGVNYTATNSTKLVYNVSVSGLTAGVYSYYLGSWNETGNGYNVSGTRSFTVIAPPPPSINFTAPTPDNGSTQSNTDIYVNLSSNSSGDHYTFLDFDNSLVGWWRMDDVNGSGDVIDLSSNSNNGTSAGNTFIYESGKIEIGSDGKVNWTFMEVKNG